MNAFVGKSQPNMELASPLGTLSRIGSEKISVTKLVLKLLFNV